MRKQQIQKIYKHYSKVYLVDMCYELGYSYNYQCELLEYSPRERYTDYSINHAHDVATINNNSNELWECSKEYLYHNMIDLITAHNDIIDYWNE